MLESRPELLMEPYNRYEPEWIELDNNEANTHGELKGDTYWVYEHEGLEYRTQEKEHKLHLKHNWNGYKFIFQGLI